MATSKEDIQAALVQLNSGTDADWTDDGLPRVDRVSALVKDAVTRRQISEAQPGFSRATPEKTTEPEDVQPGDPPVVEAHDEVGEQDDIDLDDPTSPAHELSQEDLRAAMQRKVEQATERLEDARRQLRAAQDHLVKCDGWLTKARLAYQHAFPPIPAALAIKQHLARQQELRYREAGVKYTGPGTNASQIDMVLGMRGKRGYGQPRTRTPPQAAGAR